MLAVRPSEGKVRNGGKPEAHAHRHELLLCAERWCIAAAAAHTWMMGPHPLSLTIADLRSADPIIEEGAIDDVFRRS